MTDTNDTRRSLADAYDRLEHEHEPYRNWTDSDEVEDDE